MMKSSHTRLPSPAEIVAHLDEFVLGQSRAKHDLAVAVYNHYISQAHQQLHGEDLGRHHVLMIGPTGCGKTYLIKTLSNFLGVPFAFISATDITETGYKGKDVSGVIDTLYNRADKNPRLAEKGIIFIDEVDKVKEGNYSDGKPENVQQDLLTYLDGMPAETSDSEIIDTGKILFIASGAFVGLDDIVNDRTNHIPKPEIGFHLRPTEVEEKVTPKFKLLAQSQTCDLIKFGLIPEFIGRFVTITVLHELTKSDLKELVTGVSRSSLELQKKMAAVHGLELEFTDDALSIIAEEAEKMGTGARSLNRLIGSALNSVEHRFRELADQGIGKVVITKAVILNGVEPDLVKSSRVHNREDENLRKVAMQVPKYEKPEDDLW